MTLVGIIFSIVGGLIGLINLFKRIMCRSVTKGVVVEIHRSESRDSDGHISVTYHPIFEYEVLGKVYRKKNSVGSNVCNYTVGEVVDIHYNAKNPEIYYAKGNIGIIIFGFIFMIAGIVCILY